MDWYAFAAFFIACAAAGSTGAMFPPGEWYDKLSKPGWTPPNWLFPLAWTVIYIAMSAAAARVAAIPGAGALLGLWAAQIAFNAIWSPIFFGLRRMKTALIVIALLWLSVAATMAGFLAVDRIAGLLFAPYIVWVTVAAALNASVMRRNPEFAT